MKIDITFSISSYLFLVAIARNAQSTYNGKFAISLQYDIVKILQTEILNISKKKRRDEVDLLHLTL